MDEVKSGKILLAARSVFLRYGYGRANMNDIAKMAGIARSALYVLFNSKEEIFIGVYLQWIEETMVAVNAALATDGPPVTKIAAALEAWAVRPFEMTRNSPEAQELVECGFGFAQASLRQGYARFEAAITPVLPAFADSVGMAPERMAHIIASAVGGFKQAAVTAEELRLLIQDVLRLTCRT